MAARGNNQGKKKSKLAYAPKPKIPPPPKKEDPAKDSVCHHCGDTGHWKRNCPQYPSELLKNKKLPQEASTSGIFNIKLFTFLGKSWVYDTGCGTHICNTTQGLRESRKLKPGALSLYMGNGQRAVVEAIGSFQLYQEFLDHLKKHGIIAHHTPPYMPQHNGVSERRNRTLLDIVRFMMSQTTHPKSFWDYAIESDARILNMVLTKKVEKTPYKVCYKDSIVKAAFYDYKDLDKDVKTAFLNGHLSEEDAKSYLGRCFAMKDLGEAAYILGIKIYRDRSKWLIGLCQSAYIEKILIRFFMENSKCGSILMQENFKLSKSQGASTPTEVKHMQNVPYASVVGSIMYAVRCTHPDVAFTQNITSRFQHNPGELYWTAVKNILKCVVDWKSTKQSIFATSSAEAEYIAALDASKEAVWVRKFIFGLGVVPTIKEPIKMYCDNTGAITIANESGITKGARHYRAKVHYLREVIEFGDVKIGKVYTDDNLADPFTKALAFPKHSEHTKNIVMLPASNLMSKNLARKAIREEPLAEEYPSNPIFKPLPEPPRLNRFCDNKLSFQLLQSN
ncbi:retrotransposon protein, putative, ty1-copia subclass [Tanacetum coccineum]